MLALSRHYRAGKRLTNCFGFTTYVTAAMSRIFAISDIHVDYNQNLEIVKNWSDCDYKNDVLIVAGDVTDSLELLKSTLMILRDKFSKVCFVPGKTLTYLKNRYNILYILVHIYININCRNYHHIIIINMSDESVGSGNVDSRHSKYCCT